ncbi:conserved hypothetical protein [Vibrio coralliirubri]|nr:conserved hypothetical protein [Vibrio coralliirubri]
MNRITYKQIMTIMAHYNKKGLPYRAKQVKRLIRLFEDIFEHESYLHQKIEGIGYRQLTGYFRRHSAESLKTRKEKYQILRVFFAYADIKVRVPIQH